MNDVVRVSLIVVLAVLLVLTGIGVGYLVWGGPMGLGWSMGSWGRGQSGWMHDFGGRGFPSGGMMGPGWQVGVTTGGKVTSLEEAVEAAEAYLESYYGGQGLEITEVMQFDNHFYAQAVEEDTGIGAFEILIDPRTGAVQPEHGPNMMWNAKYGMMGVGRMGGGRGMMGRSTYPSLGSMSVSAEDAVRLAQQYLDRYDPASTADDEAVAFYGYYTLHTLEDGEVTGMLSVNGETGQVWLHTWHGDFIDMTEHGHDE